MRIQVINLITKIKASKDADEIFVIWVVLLILYIILLPTSSEFVNVEYMSVLSDVRRIPKKKKASFTLNGFSQVRQQVHAPLRYFPRGKGL